MNRHRAVLLVVLFLAALPILAFQPSASSPYTFSGTAFCSSCETFSHTKVGDGFHHDSGCDQSGSPLYFCDCTIGYSPSLMLQQPILRVIDDHTVELEYFARNAYCNPPADGGNINEPNAIPFFINVIEIDPITLATNSTPKHVVPPYWEHGKVQMTDMNPGCKMYRAVYLVMDTFSNIYAVSSDVVGGNGSSSCAATPDLGPCPTCSGGAGPNGGASPGAGAPVNVGSGNMYYARPLFSVDEPGGALDFNITYNSLETNAGALGPGFTHSFATSMQSTSGSSAVRVWRKPDGTRVLFARENHPPIGEYWRPIFPGDATGFVVHDSSAGRYKWTDLSGTVTEVDDGSAGLWRTTTDRWGNTLTASYTGSNLTGITDTLGRSWTLGYSGSLLTSITDGDSNQWRFSYDGSNRLEKIFDPLHTSTTPWNQFSWTTYTTGKSAVALVTDDSGAVIEGHQYDTSGRATSSWSGDTNTGSTPSPGTNARDLVTLSYDSPTQTTVTTKIDTSLTQNTVYTLTVGHGRFLATSVVGSCGSCGATEDAQAYTFDDENHVLTKTVGLDRSGSGGTDERVTSSFTYDANGNVLTAIQAVGKTEEHTTTYAYGQANWPSFVTSITEASVAKSGQSRTSTFAWNSGETQLTATRSGYLHSSDSSATSYVTTSTFDSKHRLTEIDGPRTNQKTTRTYYSDTDTNLNRRGRLHEVKGYSTTSAFLTTSFDNYDVYGTPAKATDPNSVDTTKTLDARGRTLTVTSVHPSSDSAEPGNYVTTMVFDSRDRMTSSTSPLGNIARYVYEDGTNRLLQTIRADSSGNEHERMLLTLNTIGLKTAEAAQECPTPANPCSSWTTKRSDAFTYDAAGRLTTITHPDSTSMTHAYDSRANRISTRDERHTSANSLFAYDFRNRLKSVTQKQTIVSGSDVVTAYAYDDQDNLVTVTDPKSNDTTHAFDDFGRMQTQVSPVTGTTTYTYDEAGNLTSTTDANSATTARTFDLLNRALTATSTSSQPTETVTWTYDDSTAGHYGLGRLATMADPSGTTTYDYERRGLLRDEANDTTSLGATYAYDADGNRTTVNTLVDTQYTFDFADRPVSATGSSDDFGSATFVDSVKYLPFGPVTQLTYGNGAVKTFDYDSRYQPAENKLTLSSTVLADYVYANDEASNVTQIHDAVSSGYNRDFAYDDLNRVITANTGTSLWGSGSYSYDAAGNMTALSLGSSRSATFSYSGTTSKLSSVNSTSVSYDSAGNENDVTISARNLIARGQAHYIYDGRGVRVREYLGPTETSLAYNRYALYSPDFKLLTYVLLIPGKTYTMNIIWLNDMPVAQWGEEGFIPTSVLRYTFTDHLGTPILQMVGSAVAWQAEYEPFGSIFSFRTGNAGDQILRFPGQEAVYGDEGHSYNIFRWYRPEWSRYTQADQYGVGGGSMSDLNQLYGYAADNPEGNTDPLGLYNVVPPGGSQAADVNQAMADIMRKLNSPTSCCGPLANKVKKALSDPTLTIRISPWLMGCGFTPGSVIPGINTIFVGTKAWGKGCCYGGAPGMNALASTLLHELVHAATHSASEALPRAAEKNCYGCKQAPPPPPPVMHLPRPGQPWW